jgi:hypothetical protein
MKWIEFIKVQTSVNQDQLFEQDLKNLVKSITRKNGLDKVIVVRHSSISGDYALFLFWESKSADLSGSNIGLNVGQIFKKYGLVNHSVWLDNN